MKIKYLPFFILLMTTGTTLSYATDGEIKIMAGKKSDPLDLIGLESISYFKPILNISHFVIQCSFY
ncbi:hypothetical protein [Proteus mirabilis]|uniref:hypothetical protein n=1 Tax=Proteus mirabilis TaxID=584 RepID=UPI0022482899|nr:hypothetical protein [Proteus mirabilis]MCW9684955.1 hypothetical protein [Proteus mirabilis]